MHTRQESTTILFFCENDSFLDKLLHHFSHNRLALRFPFGSILDGVVEKLVTGFAKNSAFFEFFGEWNTVEKEKKEFV